MIINNSPNFKIIIRIIEFEKKCICSVNFEFLLSHEVLLHLDERRNLKEAVELSFVKVEVGLGFQAFRLDGKDVIQNGCF